MIRKLKPNPPSSRLSVYPHIFFFLFYFNITVQYHSWCSPGCSTSLPRPKKSSSSSYSSSAARSPSPPLKPCASSEAAALGRLCSWRGLGGLWGSKRGVRGEGSGSLTAPAGCLLLSPHWGNSNREDLEISQIIAEISNKKGCWK